MCIRLYIDTSGARAKRKQWRKTRVKFPRYTTTESARYTNYSSMTSSSNTIPRFYRVFFTVIDPILSIFGAISEIYSPSNSKNDYMLTLLKVHTSPSSILPNYSTNPSIPPSTETRLLLDALVGFFLFLAFLQVVLLRARPYDLGVWKILQAGTILVDVAMVLAFARALSNTDRMNTTTWRVEEWTNIVINSAVGFTRVLFVLGVGMRGKWKDV